jgi:hypothetical protein
MRNNILYYPLLLLLMAGGTRCKKAYEPPEITTNHNFLVVNGVINANASSQTIISLSRTRSLNDTVTFIPENGAQVRIESDANDSYFLQEAGNGDYKSDELTLATSKNYRLNIRTANGEEYISEFVPVLETPAIDSLSWKQETDVFIYVNTHDPANKTKYYRWDFVETWQYTSAYEALSEFINGTIRFRDTNEYVYNCWSNALSASILVNSSIKLAEDRIDSFRVATVPRNDTKISIKYSILVKQYALTEKAFDYWRILKINTQDLGTLFDAQPAQLTGNIRGIGSTQKPVIGYVSASTITDKRLFIRNSEVDWDDRQFSDCKVFFISPSDVHLHANNPALAPAYYVTGGGLAITTIECVDCRLQGGTTARPGFWQ